MVIMKKDNTDNDSNQNESKQKKWSYVCKPYEISIEQ